jgi:hypothetical protein
MHDALDAENAPARPWLAVALWAGFVLAACVLSIHGLGHVKDRLVPILLAGRRPSVAAVLAALDWIDFAAGAAAAALGSAAAVLEWREAAFSRLLAGGKRGPLLAMLAITLAWLSHSYCYPGVLLGGDSGAHIARFHEIAVAFGQGELPLWSNYQYLGSPVLEFTGPLTYLAGGAVAAVTGDVVVAVKALLFTLTIAAGLLLYLLLRRFGIGRFGALFGAIAFSGSFAHLHLFLFRGVFPQAFTIVFLIGAFLTAEGLMRRGRTAPADWAGFALATGGLILNHQPHALFTALYLLLFGAASLALGRWRPAALVRLCSAGAAGVLLGAVAVVPLAGESAWVMVMPGEAIFQVRMPALPRLWHLVAWSNVRTTWGIDYWAYLGLVSVVVALVGLVLGLSRRTMTDRSLTLAVLPPLAASFFVFNPVVRDIVFLLLFVSILAAIGAEAMPADRPRRRLLLIGLLMADVTSTSIQPLARTDKQFLVDAGHYLERAAPQSRVAALQLDPSAPPTMGVGPGAGPMSYDALVQRVEGYHNMAATRVHNYAVAALKLAERDLRADGRLSAATASLLATLNVARIVCASPSGNGCPEAYGGATPEGPLGRVLRVNGATPVQFSPDVTVVPAAPALDKPMFWAEDFAPPTPRVRQVDAALAGWLAVAQPDPANRRAARLPVLGVPTAAADRVAASGAIGAAKLLDYAVTLQRVRAVVEADSPGYLQLAHPAYPGNSVLVNGRPVSPMESPLHLIVLPIDAGRSTIEIMPHVTLLEIFGLAASAAGAAVIAAATILLAICHRRYRPVDRENLGTRR